MNNNSKSLFCEHIIGNKEKEKKEGKYRPTKENVYLEIKEDKELIEIKANKQRVNIMINPYIWHELGKITDNKSKFLNDIIKEIVEDNIKKTIKFVSHDV